jgi:hypothetical protein
VEYASIFRAAGGWGKSVGEGERARGVSCEWVVPLDQRIGGRILLGVEMYRSIKGAR